MEEIAQQQKQIRSSNQQYSKLLRDCKDIPFWIEDPNNHKQINQVKGRLCCFNHYIGLPFKGERQLPIFKYETDILNLLENGEKYLWICKATSLGISEFFLRYIAWKSIKSNEWHNCKVIIVTGPRIELSITLIDRLKKLFLNLGITFESNQTVVELNHCRVEAFPSHHVDTIRGLTDVKMIMVDEASFFPPGQQQEVRDAVERYIAKSDPIIIMVSTPGAPQGMFYEISQEP